MLNYLSLAWPLGSVEKSNCLRGSGVVEVKLVLLGDLVHGFCNWPLVRVVEFDAAARMHEVNGLCASLERLQEPLLQGQ